MEPSTLLSRRKGGLGILNINFWPVIALLHSAAAVKTDNRKRGARERGAIGKAWKGERESEARRAESKGKCRLGGMG